jgi:hypothetical protein
MPAEVKNLNRKQRNKMAVVKEGMEVTEVIIQEGVPTFERVDEGAAEPVVYMIDRYVVGGFYRVNTARGIDENLNAPGMTFKPLAFETGCSLPDCPARPRRAAQPLLCLWRDRTAGDAGGLARTGTRGTGGIVKLAPSSSIRWTASRPTRTLQHGHDALRGKARPPDLDHPAQCADLARRARCRACAAHGARRR